MNRCAATHPKWGQCHKPAFHDARNPKDPHDYRWSPAEYVRRIAELDRRIAARGTVGLLDVDVIMRDSLIDALRELPETDR